MTRQRDAELTLVTETMALPVVPVRQGVQREVVVDLLKDLIDYAVDCIDSDSTHAEIDSCTRTIIMGRDARDAVTVGLYEAAKEQRANPVKTGPLPLQRVWESMLIDVASAGDSLSQFQGDRKEIVRCRETFDLWEIVDDLHDSNGECEFEFALEVA